MTACLFCRSLIFVFEERLPDEEQEFMQELGLGASSEGALNSTLSVEELKGEAVTIEYEQSLQGAGGHADTELWNPSLFWTPPPIRMFILRPRR